MITPARSHDAGHNVSGGEEETKPEEVHLLVNTSETQETETNKEQKVNEESMTIEDKVSVIESELNHSLKMMS